MNYKKKYAKYKTKYLNLKKTGKSKDMMNNTKSFNKKQILDKDTTVSNMHYNNVTVNNNSKISNSSANKIIINGKVNLKNVSASKIKVNGNLKASKLSTTSIDIYKFADISNSSLNIIRLHPTKSSKIMLKLDDRTSYTKIKIIDSNKKVDDLVEFD
jgi:hypothetical protein